MSDDDDTGRRLAAIRARIVESRHALVAACVALLAVAALSGGSLLWALLGAVAVVLVAALAPRGAIGPRRSGRTDPLRKAPMDALTARALASAVPDPLVVFDRDGTLVHANDAAIAAFGPMAAGTALQLKFRAPEMQQLIAGVIREGRADQIEYAERVPVERWFGVSAVAVGEDTGLFVLVFKDLSETRRIERMRSDFVANASHELRTPLASITGFIETLRGSARDDARAREQFLQIMEGQTARMARLIDDLLSLSRLEMKPYLKPSTKVDIRNVLDSVIDSLKPMADDLGVAIEKRFQDGAHEVFGDRDELIQVFENLLENACKYGQSGKRVVVSLEGEISAAGHDVRVTIRDFGPGIAEEHIPRITERFYRVDVETSRSRKGTGLGLSIVKHILTRHRARLTIESEPGEGASFTVHFRDI